jgi:NADH dehydrogenase (ubiquinone) 1 beta subcomplex subunit 7
VAEHSGPLQLAFFGARARALTLFASTRPFHAPAAAPASHEAMREARLPISFRDGCAGLLIPLNKCRQANMYSPFRCGHERHEYEKCMYIECVLAGRARAAPLPAHATHCFAPLAPPTSSAGT